MTSGTSTQRVCFVLHVRPDRLPEYRERHVAVWPEMLRELEASGRRNYSIFLDDDGLLIGYFETDDLDASNAYLTASPVAARWEAEMASFFTDAGARADSDMHLLTEVFNLSAQLASTEADTEGSTQ